MDLAGKFMPMVGLFFLLAFVNTILDSLKDTLVITATGGGAQVIPYLTVYAVLPSSLAFLVAYSFASQHMSRPALFNAILGAFMAFFVLFAFVLYPNHAALHPHDMADALAKVLPLGVEGLVGMVRNWTFTAFFCMSELWGDVCLGLLFWGLANDTTQLSDAPTLYPLFGLGANVAQALAGTTLKVFSSPATSHSGLGFGSEIQHLMVVVIALSCAALGLHGYINARHEAAAHAAAAAVAPPAAPAPATAVNGGASSNGVGREHGSGGQGDVDAKAEAQDKDAKVKPSVQEIFRVLAASTPIRCLAIMSLAQGLCTSLMEFAWKSHIGLLYPSPAQFTAFLGDVSMWQGTVTGGLMVLSPALFARMGWAGVAGATPGLLLVGGAVFFAACLIYQWAFAGHAAASLGHAAASLANGVGAAAGVTAGWGGAVLQFLVFAGALLYVFSKSAKFSLFKPAEEMVYISLDEEGRTKGKAAIDVVGAQAGKSGGSMLQQALLLASGGGIGAILPVLAACYFAMAQGWLKAVSILAAHDDYGNMHNAAAATPDGAALPPPPPHPTLARGAAMGDAQAATSQSGSGSGSNGVGNGSSSNGSGTDGPVSPSQHLLGEELEPVLLVASAAHAAGLSSPAGPGAGPAVHNGLEWDHHPPDGGSSSGSVGGHMKRPPIGVVHVTPAPIRVNGLAQQPHACAAVTDVAAARP